MTDARVEDYLMHLQFERGLSENSLSAYRRDLQELIKFAEGRPLHTLTQRDASQFVKELTGLNRKPSTIARKLSSMRGFYLYLLDSNIIIVNPFDAFSAPKIARYHPHSIWDSQHPLKRSATYRQCRQVF